MELNPERNQIRQARLKRKRKFKPKKTETDLAEKLEKTKQNLNEEGETMETETEGETVEVPSKKIEEYESEEGKWFNSKSLKTCDKCL